MECDVTPIGAVSVDVDTYGRVDTNGCYNATMLIRLISSALISLSCNKALAQSRYCSIKCYDSVVAFYCLLLLFLYAVTTKISCAGLEVIKNFMPNSTEHKIDHAHR